MSYILDALKRADAERERGAVPGLHTSQMQMPTPTVRPAAPRYLWPAIAGVLLIGGVTGALWLWQTPASLPAASPSVATATPQPARPTTPAPAITAPVAQVVAPAVAPVVIAASTPASLPPLATPANAPAHPAKTSAARPVQTKAPTPAIAAVSTPQPEARLPMLNDLPADLRSQLPKLTITGAVYSNDPSQRLLLINNQVFTQGASVAPGLTLEEIQPHSAVLSFQGTRFRMPH